MDSPRLSLRRAQPRSRARLRARARYTGFSQEARAEGERRPLRRRRVREPLSIITASFHGEERGRAFGIWAARRRRPLSGRLFVGGVRAIHSYTTRKEAV